MLRVSTLLDVTERKRRRVAKESGLTLDRVNEIALGAAPSLQEAVALSKALRVPLAAVLADTDRASAPAMKFRALLSKSSTARSERAVADLSSKIDGYSEILRAAGYERRRRGFAVGENVSPRELAESFRTQCFGGDDVSPLLSLPRVVDQCLGVVLIVTRSDEVDGASAFIDNIPFCMIRAQFKPRMLFTLAHELAHLLLHWQLGEFAKADSLGSVSRGRMARTADPEERFANEFASELLMPREGVGIALKEIRAVLEQTDDHVGDIEILFLARIFCVSFDTAAHRCERLELLPEGGALALIHKLSEGHSSPEKRAEEIGLPPRPDLDFPAVPEVLLSAASRAIENGQISIGRAVESLGVSYSSLRSEARTH